MRLDRRLRLLRGEAAPARASAPASSNLFERLRRLSPAAPRPAHIGPADESDLAARLGAKILSPGLLRVEHRVPLLHRHGRVGLGDCAPALPSLIECDPGDPTTWLFLDTETSGLAGGTGTWAFLCGLARIDEPELLLRQYLLTRLDAEPAYLAAVCAELDQARLLVTYNGKTFDAPLLATRFRLSGMQSPLANKTHLDLLTPVRRAFAAVWPDCRLATAEDRLLGLRRVGDLPGAEAPLAWLSWLRAAQIEPLAGVLEHNRRDLLSLPALVPVLARSFVDPVATGADIRAVASLHLKRGADAEAFRLLNANREVLPTAGLLDLARLYRQRGEWPPALAIWERLAADDEAKAIESLAKYLEHQARDYRRALAIAGRLPASPEREHRCRRLRGRLAGKGLISSACVLEGVLPQAIDRLTRVGESASQGP